MTIATRLLAGMALAGILAGNAIAQQAPVTLQFWEGHSLQEETATLKMIEAFEKANPDIRIQRTKVAFGGNFEKITTAVASNTAPDVSPIWGGFLTQFAAAGALLDLSKSAGSMKSAIYPASWQYVQWHGGIYSIPYAQDPRMIVYNVAALKDANITPPATLDELAATAKALTRKNGDVVDRYGLAIGDNDTFIYFFVNLLDALGGTVFNEDETKVVFDGPAGLAAGKFYARLIKDGGLAVNVPQENMRQGLLSGRFAMTYDGPWIFYTASTLGKPFQPFDVAPFPAAKPGDKSVTISSIGAYVVFSQTKHPAEAARFVEFMGSPAGQQYRIGLLKPGVSPGVVDQPIAKDTFAKWPALATTQRLNTEAVTYPVQAKWTRVVDALRSALEAIGSGSDPAEALHAAARQADRGLRR
jgi:ABC-type glycerol-3-phosphate transport system substrate-binding protein